MNFYINRVLLNNIKLIVVFEYIIGYIKYNLRLKILLRTKFLKSVSININYLINIVLFVSYSNLKVLFKIYK